MCRNVGAPRLKSGLYFKGGTIKDYKENREKLGVKNGK